MKKSLIKTYFSAITLFSLLFIGVPSVSAAFPGPTEGIGQLINSLFSTISSIFTLSFLDSPDAKWGFFRFLLWILIFTILYLAGRIVFARLNAGNAVPGVIAAVMATGTIIVIPQSVIISIFQTYGIVLVTIIMMVAIAGLLYLVYAVINFNPPWLLHLVRLIAIILCWWITAEVLSMSTDMPTTQQNTITVPKTTQGNSNVPDLAKSFPVVEAGMIPWTLLTFNKKKKKVK